MTEKVCKKTTIGGQALIEGVLMRGPEKTAIAVRKPNHEIDISYDDTQTMISKGGLYSLPLIRGIITLIDSMKLGSRALMYSASFFEEEPTERPKKSWTEKIFKSHAEKVENTAMFLFSFLVAMLLFFFIPTLITSFFKRWVSSTIWLNLIEGLVRIGIFLGYVTIISRIDDLRRVFEYHGAEHKSIYCYEKGLPLTVENVRKQSILHPRCGTSFLFTVMLVSIVLLSFFGWPHPLVRMMIRLLMLPIIVGVSYEINRYLGRREGLLTKIFTAPGLFVQKIATVKEPDDLQIEVAIAALKEVIPTDRGSDIW